MAVWGLDRALISVTVFALAMVLSCSSEAVPTPTEGFDGLTAEEILAKAGERFDSLHTFHFKLTHEGGGTPIALGLEMVEAEGDVATPDRMVVTIQARASGLFLEVTAISIGDDTYLTNPFTREYEDLTGVITPGGFFDPAEGIGTIIKRSIDPSLVAEETLGGIAAYRLAGSVRSEDLKAVTGSAVEGHTLKAEIWIGKEDFLVRKLTLDGRITRNEEDGITRTFLLSAFDQPVTIEAPQVGRSP